MTVSVWAVVVLVGLNGTFSLLRQVHAVASLRRMLGDDPASVRALVAVLHAVRSEGRLPQLRRPPTNASD